jgi:ABC-type transporter Mla subunit MlaD
LQKIDKRELNRIGTVTLVGVAALVLIIFWLKGHKIHQYQKFTFYFRNVNGLEEGNALRWNGLKIGLVDSINPVTHSFKQQVLPAKALIELGERHLAKARDLLHTHNLGDLIIAQEEITKAELEIALGRASSKQTDITEESFIEVNVVVTTPDVPIGPLNQVTIVPSGIIGEQYVDLSTIEIDKDFEKQYDIETTQFIVLEPIRLDSLIRANTESAIAIKNLSNRLNALFSNNDAENVSQLISNSEQTAEKLNKTLTNKTINDFQNAMNNIRNLSDNFTLWKFLGFSNNRKKVKAQVQ